MNKNDPFTPFFQSISAQYLVHIPAYSNHFQNGINKKTFHKFIIEQAGHDMKNSTSDEKSFKDKKLPLTIFKKSCAVAL